MAKYPAALKMAKQIANDTTDKNLQYSDIWLTKVAGNPGAYSIRYKLPKTEGFFACNIELDLTEDQMEEYNEWVENNL